MTGRLAGLPVKTLIQERHDLTVQHDAAMAWSHRAPTDDRRVEQHREVARLRQSIKELTDEINSRLHTTLAHGDVTAT